MRLTPRGGIRPRRQVGSYAPHPRRAANPVRLERLEARTLMCDWGASPGDAAAARAAAKTAVPSLLASVALPTSPELRAAAAAAAATPLAPAPGTTTLRIETAGSSSFTDSSGRVWAADSGFSGGSVSTGAHPVGGTSDDKLYYTRRWGNFSYARAVSNGRYTLRLHFFDPIYTKAGYRKFDAFAEGTQILNDFDIAGSGAVQSALVKTFTVNVTDGRLDLSFRRVKENPILSAVELLPAGAAPAPKTAPPAPTDAAAAAALSRITVSWSDRSTSEEGFRIERKNGTYGTWKQIATTAANTARYVDEKSLRAGENYYYRVRAYNTAGTSSPSTETKAARVSISSITWRGGAASPITRAEAARGVVNGKVYVFGGYYNADIEATPRADVYDPGNNTWKRIADMPVAMSHQGMVVDGSTIWLVGGYVGDHPGPGSKMVWKYNAALNKWSRGPDLPEARGAGAAAIVGRKIYFFGGMNEARTVDMGTHWVLDIDNQPAGWKRLADMPNPRNHLTGISHDGKVYAIGGHWKQEDDAVTQNEVDRYDPGTNKWTRVASTPTLRSQTPAAAVIWQDKILLVGGADRTQNSTTVISAYLPGENRWEDIGHLPAARRATVAAIIGNRLIVTTGNDPYPSATTWISSLLDS